MVESCYRNATASLVGTILKQKKGLIMYPYQEADENAASAYSYASPSPYLSQGAGEHTSSAYDYTPSNVSNEPAPAELLAVPELVSERNGLMVDLLAYPWRSVRSLCRPGLRTFSRETLHARWGVVWLTVFGLPLLSSLIALLLGIPEHLITSGVLAGILLTPLIVIPILFLIVQGMMWPLACHYQGGGTFLQQCYTTFLPLAPLFFVGSVASILLAIGSTSAITGLLVLIELPLFIYSSVLLVVSLKAVHGLTTWEAFTLAILPILFILAVLVIVLIVAFLLGSSSDSKSSSNKSNNKSNNNNSNNGDNNNSNTNSDTGTFQQPSRHYRNDSWWWWGGGPSYARRSTNRGTGSKILWLCPACQYRRWLRRGVEGVTCVRCDMPMQPTEAMR